MNNLGYDLFIASVSAILGAVFGVVIPKLLKDENTMPEIHIDRQLVFSQIHIEQNQYIVNNKGYQKENTNSTNKGQSTSGGEMFLGYLIVALMLVVGFLKYEKQISTVILCIFIFLEVTFLTTAYVTVKKHYIDRSIKTILLFNILSTVGVPIFLYLVKKPMIEPILNKQELLRKTEESGIFSLLFEMEAFGFLLYQVLGLIILLGFMLFTLLGILHVLAMISLTLMSRFSKIWIWIYKNTLGFCKSASFYIFFGSSLLALSFLFVSGVLWMLINKISIISLNL